MSLSNSQTLLNNFGEFQPERLNQRISRMLLSVHKKTSRMACLGELGRYPLIINSLVHSIKYEWHLRQNSGNASLIGMAYNEMTSFSASGGDCWLSKINKIKCSLGVNTDNVRKPVSLSKIVNKAVKGKFDGFWLESINQFTPNQEGRDTNKLRFYKSFKGSFTEEPYLSSVLNRNQRSSLTRLRKSAHHLQIERGRWTNTPLENRLCRYCDQDCVDTEHHFLLHCQTFTLKRHCFFG